MVNNTVKDVLRNEIEKNGIEILNNKRYCISILKDLAPNDTQGIEDIKWAFDKNILSILVKENNNTLSEKQNAFNKIYSQLTETFNESTSKRICNILIYSVNWNIAFTQTRDSSSSSNTSKPNNIPKTKTKNHVPTQFSNNSKSLSNPKKSDNLNCQAPPQQVPPPSPIKRKSRNIYVFLLWLFLILFILFTIISIIKNDSSPPRNELNMQETTSYNFASESETSDIKSEASDIRSETSKIKSEVSYLGKDIKANNGAYYTEINGESSFLLGGLSYYNGFLLGTYSPDCYISFNLEGKYKYLSGIVGNVDKIQSGLSYSVYGDDILIGNIDIVESGLPVEFNFEISDVKQLRIVAEGNQFYDRGVGFANVVVYNDINEKPELFTATNYLSEAFLGTNIKAYQCTYDYHECGKDGEVITIQGKKYYNGFKIGSHPRSGFAYFNLNSEYKHLSGKIYYESDVPLLSYSVYGDGNYIGSIDVSKNEVKDFYFDVSGVKQLLIKGENDLAWNYQVSFADVIVSKE